MHGWQAGQGLEVADLDSRDSNQSGGNDGGLDRGALRSTVGQGSSGCLTDNVSSTRLFLAPPRTDLDHHLLMKPCACHVPLLTDDTCTQKYKDHNCARKLQNPSSDRSLVNITCRKDHAQWSRQAHSTKNKAFNVNSRELVK